jgi:hypothetical protein
MHYPTDVKRAREILTGRLCRFKYLVGVPSVIVVRFEDSDRPEDIITHRIDPHKPRFILLEDAE